MEQGPAGILQLKVFCENTEILIYISIKKIIIKSINIFDFLGKCGGKI